MVSPTLAPVEPPQIEAPPYIPRPPIAPRRPRLVFGEIVSFAYETFCTNKVRFALTALGMMIGTASLILVVTISLTGKQYVLNQIQSIGAELGSMAEYQGGSQRINNAAPDLLTLDDLAAVRARFLPSSPLRQRSIFPIGFPSAEARNATFTSWVFRRNIAWSAIWSSLSGRFFDQQDEQARSKVGSLVDKLAE